MSFLLMERALIQFTGEHGGKSKNFEWINANGRTILIKHKKYMASERWIRGCQVTFFEKHGNKSKPEID
jgi:hypothetical protein